MRNQQIYQQVYSTDQPDHRGCLYTFATQGLHLWPFLCVFISPGVLWSKCMKLNMKLVVRLEDFRTNLQVSDTASVLFPCAFSLTFDTATWQVHSGLHHLMLAGGSQRGCRALALPQVTRGFYRHGPQWKTGLQPWRNWQHKTFETFTITAALQPLRVSRSPFLPLVSHLLCFVHH